MLNAEGSWPLSSPPCDDSRVSRVNGAQQSPGTDLLGSSPLEQRGFGEPNDRVRQLVHGGRAGERQRRSNLQARGFMDRVEWRIGGVPLARTLAGDGER